MPNTCTNMLYLSTKDKGLCDRLTESIVDSFYSCDVQPVDNGDVFTCEMEFDSRWTFPHKEMEELTSGLPEGNDLYIRVLSYEFGCEYVGFNIYTGGEWCDKLADR
ncbi:MAG: hypothetical protein LBI82_05755 [Dysgonamonadaceae bacterium]|nr:hypothetical protein [Dysgonamonadaceae bacterium]